MRRWIRNLHGGQLIILLIGIAAVGSAIFGIGYKLSMDADADFSLSGKLRYGLESEGFVKDTVLAEHFMRQGMDTGRVSLRFLLAGVIVLAALIPTLWIWFGARRRDTIPHDALAR